MAYKRILLKLSGEQLSGDLDTGIDPEVAAFFAGEVKKAASTGCQVVIMVGGGNHPTQKMRLRIIYSKL